MHGVRGMASSRFDGRVLWLLIFGLTAGTIVVVCLATAAKQILSGISFGTTRPGHDATELVETQELSSQLSSYASALATSTPCEYDATRESDATRDVLRRAETLSLDAAAAASFAELLVTCTRRASCVHRGGDEPPQSSASSGAPLDEMLRAWRDAIAEWRDFGCQIAGPFVEAAVAQSAVCHAEPPWPRMLATALLSAVPCTLPATRTNRPRLFGGADQSIT